MSEVCDYVYISGLRFKSGTPFIEIPSWYLDVLTDKTTTDRTKTVRLCVVRDGKGASRTERWALKPSKLGVVGEINLRDLKRVMLSNNESEIEALIPVGEDGVSSLVPLAIDPSLGMGREGRVLNRENIENVLESLPDNVCQALLLNQLRNMPYGLENSRAAGARLQVILKYAEMKTLTESIEAGHVDFVKHMDRETIKHTSNRVVMTLLARLERYRDQSLQHEEAWGVLSARIWETELENVSDQHPSNPREYSDFPLKKLPDVRWRHQVDEDLVVALCLTRMRAALRETGDYGPITMVRPWISVITNRESAATLFGAVSDMVSADCRDDGEWMGEELARRYNGDTDELVRIAKRHRGRMLGRAAESAIAVKTPTGTQPSLVSRPAGKSLQVGMYEDEYDDLTEDEIMDL